MTYFYRSESDTNRAGTPVETNVSADVALAEVNHAMMDGKKDVLTMSAGSGKYAIAYKDGRIVILIKLEGDLPEPAEEAPAEYWSVAGFRMLLHKFDTPDENGRAACNRRFRARQYVDGYAFRTREQWDAYEYGYQYTFCPRCEAK